LEILIDRFSTCRVVVPRNVSLACLAGACEIPELRLDADPMGKMRGGGRLELDPVGGRSRRKWRGRKYRVLDPLSSDGVAWGARCC
jgi:hypothetical protein